MFAITLQSFIHLFDDDSKHNVYSFSVIDYTTRSFMFAVTSRDADDNEKLKENADRIVKQASTCVTHYHRNDAGEPYMAIYFNVYV